MGFPSQGDVCKWVLRLLGLLENQTKPLCAGSHSGAVVLKSKAASTCSHSCKWGTSQRHRTVCYSGLQRGDTWWPGKKFPHCLPCVHWGCPVCWGACGEMHLCALLPSVKVAEGQDLCAPFQDVSTFLLFFFLFFWQRLFPALSKPVNEVPVTPDRACLWRRGRRKKTAEGEGRQSIVLEARELLKH